MKIQLRCFYLALFSAIFIHSLFALGTNDLSKISQRELAILQFETAFQNGTSPYGTLQARMKHHGVPGLSMALLDDGDLLWAKAYGAISASDPTPVDTETVFSIASISKLVTAMISLRLADANIIDLNQDIDSYLIRWQVPPTSFTQNQPVTLRHIMSHTAGFNVHGFLNFQPEEALPTVLDTLHGRPPARNEPIRVTFVPGSQFRYSGGGITVQQLLIEDITGLNFVDAAWQWLFDPLAMDRSTFLNPLPASHGNIAHAHDNTGRPVALPRGWESMPEMAAAGLWSTPSDMALLLEALLQAYRGEDEAFLSQALVQDMLTPKTPSPFGLGPEMFTAELFGHGGVNNSYISFLIADKETGNGLIIFTNSSNGGAMIGEIITTVRRMGHF